MARKYSGIDDSERNARLFPWIAWILRKQNGEVRNHVAIADAKWSIGKGRKELLFEKLWPLIFFVGFALFMLWPR